MKNVLVNHLRKNLPLGVENSERDHRAWSRDLHRRLPFEVSAENPGAKCHYWHRMSCANSLRLASNVAESGWVLVARGREHALCFCFVLAKSIQSTLHIQTPRFASSQDQAVKFSITHLIPPVPFSTIHLFCLCPWRPNADFIVF